jgi:hypothetical protein
VCVCVPFPRRTKGAPTQGIFLCEAVEFHPHPSFSTDCEKKEERMNAT